MTKLRTYTELMSLETYEDRINYLRLEGVPFEETFGDLRDLNQIFYKSKEWRALRGAIIHRDGGRDLALPNRPISGRVFVHHMNPIGPHTLMHEEQLALDPEYLITVSADTHQMIHYGREEFIVMPERVPGDTKLW